MNLSFQPPEADDPRDDDQLSMTNDIIRMAREAGIPFNKYGLIGCDTCECDIDNELERFAALVAAAEREACAKVCEMVKESTCDLFKKAGAYESAKAIRARSDVINTQSA